MLELTVGSKHRSTVSSTLLSSYRCTVSCIVFSGFPPRTTLRLIVWKLKNFTLPQKNQQPALKFHPSRSTIHARTTNHSMHQKKNKSKRVPLRRASSYLGRWLRSTLTSNTRPSFWLIVSNFTDSRSIHMRSCWHSVHLHPSGVIWNTAQGSPRGKTPYSPSSVSILHLIKRLFQSDCLAEDEEDVLSPSVHSQLLLKMESCSPWVCISGRAFPFPPNPEKGA